MYSTFDQPPVTDLVQLPEHRSVPVLEDNAAAVARIPVLFNPFQISEAKSNAAFTAVNPTTRILNDILSSRCDNFSSPQRSKR